MILNGLLNNIIIPIATKLSIVYSKSTKIINLPTIISFLIFSLINVPVNHFLDKRGVKTGYMIGLSIYALGIFLICFVSKAFPFLIIGFIVFSFGQPFILNLSAKIATYWFLPENVPISLFRELWPPRSWLVLESSVRALDLQSLLLSRPKSPNKIKIKYKLPSTKYFLCTLDMLSRPVCSSSLLASSSGQNLLLQLLTLMKRRNYL